MTEPPHRPPPRRHFEEDDEAKDDGYSELRRRRKGTSGEEVEGRISRSQGGADFLARIKRSGFDER